MPKLLAILIGTGAVVTGTSAEFGSYAATFGVAAGIALVLDKLTAIPAIKLIER